jgi:BirA family biotin operon repressor/biotin-[acetyl-CoA-carboxylase] ligase
VISLRVGLAVAGALERAGVPAVRLKWPNDLMLYDRKLGGILCEARWQGSALGWVAVGVGLNISNAVPHELRTVAITLSQVRPDLEHAQVLDPIVSALRALDLRGDRLSPAELDQFAARSWLSGRQIREPLLGVVTGVSEDGTLRVRDASGSQVALRNASIELASSPSTL